MIWGLILTVPIKKKYLRHLYHIKKKRAKVLTLCTLAIRASTIVNKTCVAYMMYNKKKILAMRIIMNDTKYMK